MSTQGHPSTFKMSQTLIVKWSLSGVGTWSGVASIYMVNTGSKDLVGPDEQILMYTKRCYVSLALQFKTTG